MEARYTISEDTIVALATPQGTGAIAVIRLSGKDAFAICSKVFGNKKMQLINVSELDSHTVHFGVIYDLDIILDEVLVTLFKAPNSYNGENIVEISCHGSGFIQQQLLQLLIRSGARMANPGEFTLRGFLNGKFDLSQAEAVSDLIASNSATSHQVAMMQMRGGFSDKIKTLRSNLVDFASLVELELDFSEEDVEFADRDDLKTLINSIQTIIKRLVDSFEIGNVIKNGIPVAIVGKPNAGKSTLLNVLLEDDKAIVSDVPGTTRDAIEDEITIGGVLFRFIDTAGIRSTSDAVETMGVARTFDKIKQSTIVIYLFDVNEITSKELAAVIEETKGHLNNSQLLLVGNKVDKADMEYTMDEFSDIQEDIIFISAKGHDNMDELRKKLVELFDSRTVNITETVVTNVRHVEALRNTHVALTKVLQGLGNNIPGDLLAIDIKEALYQLGLITGEISSDDLLTNIFSRFCIGK